MKLRLLSLLMLAAATTLLCGCSKSRPAEAAVAPTPAMGSAPHFLPKARIYKTNGNFAQLVPITLNSERTAVVSYPAPSDLRNSEPVALADGWLLDRRGISYQTAFLRTTYAEYMALPSAPSRGQLLGLVNPSARVTQIVEMPFPYSGECASECNKLIRSGLPGCVELKP